MRTSNAIVGLCVAISLAACAEGSKDMKPSHPDASAMAGKKPATPAQGYTIHVIAPHKFEDGTIHGPYHHYCKPISADVFQCLLFESTDANALLTDIEYFVAKPVARSAVSLDTWNKYYHDHEVEIATGRVQVLDVPEDKQKEIAAAAAKTDGIIFHLWPDGAKAPNGEVGHPQSVGHRPRTE
jgi:hypothetical protein